MDCPGPDCPGPDCPGPDGRTDRQFPIASEGSELRFSKVFLLRFSKVFLRFSFVGPHRPGQSGPGQSQDWDSQDQDSQDQDLGIFLRKIRKSSQK